MAAKSWLSRADDVLRGDPWTTRPGAIGPLIAMAVAGGSAYGALMGTFGGFAGGRAWQVLGSALKVPMLLGVTLLLSLPSFFVLNTLAGLRADFGRVLRGVFASQAGLAIVLMGLAPITLFWYASTSDYRPAILFNGAMFAVASLGAQAILRRAYRPLIARDGRHRSMLRAWLALYIFVGIEMGWVLRPFVGNPEQPVELFRADSLGNAYVEVARLAYQTLVTPAPGR
ncbi:MAG: hypothetical protein U0800_27900 [Isosphaeraceae bacterium]